MSISSLLLLALGLVLCTQQHVHAQCNAMRGAARCTSTTYESATDVKGKAWPATRCVDHAQECQNKYDAYKYNWCDGRIHKLKCSMGDTERVNCGNPSENYKCKDKANCLALAQQCSTGADIHRATIATIERCLNGRLTFDRDCDPARVATHDEALDGIRNGLAECNKFVVFFTSTATKFSDFAKDGRTLVEVQEQEFKARLRNYKHAQTEQRVLQAA